MKILHFTVQIWFIWGNFVILFSFLVSFQLIDICRYCSSDNWAGTRDPIGTNGTDSWYFKGSVITKVIVQELLNMGMNEQSSVIAYYFLFVNFFILEQAITSGTKQLN